jgi:hypothetical protein
MGIAVAFAMGDARDVSRHGMCIDLSAVSSIERVPSVGERVTLRFFPPNAHEVIVASALIVRLEHDPNHTLIAIGVEFDGLDAAHLKTIDEYVQAKLEGNAG